MTNLEIRNIVENLRRKAGIFKKSGCATTGIVKCFEESADTIEQLAEELKQWKDKQEQGLLPELPTAIDSTVYVISMCSNVETVMDGDFETATGYYCPFELKSQCPHDCDDCEDVKNKWAVFEDTVSYIGIDRTGIHLFTEDTGICCTIGKDAFFNKEEAEEALAKMNKED